MSLTPILHIVQKELLTSVSRIGIIVLNFQVWERTTLNASYRRLLKLFNLGPTIAAILNGYERLKLKSEEVKIEFRGWMPLPHAVSFVV